MASKPFKMDEDVLQSIFDWFEKSLQYIHDEIKGNKTFSLESLNGNVLGKLTFKQKDKIQSLSTVVESMRNKVKALFNEMGASQQGPVTCENMTDFRKEDEKDKNMIPINEITIMLKEITAYKGVAIGPGTLVHGNTPPQYEACKEEVYNLVKETVALHKDAPHKDDRSAHELLTYVNHLEKCQACEWPDNIQLKCYKPSSSVFLAVDKLYKIARHIGIENNKHKLELQSARSQISALHDVVYSSDTYTNTIRPESSARKGAKLKQINPVIAELSDVNRPTKIAEQFSELYDDEWTDAFNVQTAKMHRSKQQASGRLLDMLKDAVMFCTRTSKVPMNNILKELELSDVSRKSYTTPTLTIQSMNDIQRKYKDELRRMTSSLSTKQLECMFVEHMKDEQKEKYDISEIQEFIPFLEKCVVVCWYMVLQDPPVVIQFEKENANKKPFRGNEYRFYSRSGLMFDYIVWPPLRLVEGGDILLKGIAQPLF